MKGKKIALGLMFLSAFFISSCTKSSSDDVASPLTSCSADADCPNGDVCNDTTKTCEVVSENKCSVDADCTENSVCNLSTQVCEANPATECTSSAECSEGKICNAETKLCEMPPASPPPSQPVDPIKECVDDSVCSAAGKICDLTTNKCAAKKCEVSATCQTGFVCNASKECEAGCNLNAGKCTAEQICNGATSVCDPKCRSNPDCQVGYACNTGTGICEELPKECTSDSQCSEGKVCDTVSTYKCQEKICAATSDCPTGFLCNAETLKCEAGCTKGLVCAADKVCSSETFKCEACIADSNCLAAGKICDLTTYTCQAKTCSSNADCLSLPGYLCDAGAGTCTAGCTVANNCTITQECNPSSYLCEEIPEYQLPRVSAGITHTCGLKDDQSLFCWGANSVGQFGNGLTTNTTIPVQISPEGTWKTISSGYNHTCGIKESDKKLYCWGGNSYGQLGDGSTGNRLTPKLVSDVSPASSVNTWKSVAAGTYHTCGITTDKKLYCWGITDYAQSPITNPEITTIPTQVGSSDETWVSVSLSDYTVGAHACALNKDYKIFCWGFNNSGQLGTGDTLNKLVPTQIADSSTWKSVATGAAHTCAIKQSDSRLYCWGLNYLGRLADGTTVSRSLPTQVLDAGSWRSVSAGYDHTCGVKSDDMIYCWGQNYHGQLGIGNTTTKMAPTAINLLGEWKFVSAGSTHTCAVNIVGNVYCWGRGDLGQVGTGVTVQKNLSPALAAW